MKNVGVDGCMGGFFLEFDYFLQQKLGIMIWKLQLRDWDERFVEG
jgi:hypothetical protein